ncbi:MAG: phasin family protein [Robiginitomaculum sp.]|nr:phasin family protein [Robiginitomaculum sp.]
MAKKSKTTVEQSTDLARKIWLAGVGAYGQAYTNTREGMEKAGAYSSEVFDELVERGEKIEEEVRETVTTNDRVSKVVEAAGKFGARRRALFSERVGAVRKGLGLDRGVFTMDEKLDALTEQMSALTKEVAAIKKSVKPARKTTAKKAASKKVATKKAAPKKAATKTVAKAATIKTAE